jgi:hypothetical protein
MASQKPGAGTGPTCPSISPSMARRHQSPCHRNALEIDILGCEHQHCISPERGAGHLVVRGSAEWLIP